MKSCFCLVSWRSALVLLGVRPLVLLRCYCRKSPFESAACRSWFVVVLSLLGSVKFGGWCECIDLLGGTWAE